MDNDQSANLEKLIEAGVTSFKIEGRLKDAAYVKNITAYYREKLDKLIAAHTNDAWRAASLGHCTFTFTPDPARTFHRGETDYFVNGRRRDRGTRYSEKHRRAHRPRGKTQSQPRYG